MNFKSRVVLMLCFCLLPFFACNAFGGDLETFKSSSGVLKIAGGTAHIPVIKEAAKRIMIFNPDVQITVGAGGSGAGIKQVGEGLIDIGNSGRKPTDAEIEKYNLKLYKWAIDGVAVIVNPANNVRNLSSETLESIFSGAINNWKELGGEDRGINIYTRDEASGTRKVFWKKALNKGKIASHAQFVVSNGAMKSAVAQDPYAIGYMSAGYIDQSVAGVALNGTFPDTANINSGKYPVARGLYSNTKGEAKELSKLFIDFLFSPSGQAIVAEKGFIPVK